MAIFGQEDSKKLCKLLKAAMIIGNSPCAQYTYSQRSNCFSANVPPSKKLIISYCLKIPVTTMLDASM